MPQPHSKTKKAFSTLTSVLIVSAVVTTLAVAMLLTGSSAADNSSLSGDYVRAKAAAAACAETALQLINDSAPYTGTGNLTINGGSCTHTVTNTGGQNRLIQVTGTVGEVTRRAQIVIDAINPTISLVTWLEVSTF